MRKSKFTESQIAGAIREHENGRRVEDICAALGIKKVTFYKWRQKYGGLEVDLLKKMRNLEEENSRLKRLNSNYKLVYDAFRLALLKSHISNSDKNKLADLMISEGGVSQRQAFKAMGLAQSTARYQILQKKRRGR